MDYGVTHRTGTLGGRMDVGEDYFSFGHAEIEMSVKQVETWSRKLLYIPSGSQERGLGSIPRVVSS